MINLPATGVCRYRGHTFSGAMLTTGFKCEAVQSADKRTIKELKYVVTISDVINRNAAAGVSTDDDMDALAAELMEQGGEFEYKDKGFGEFSINTGGDQKDLSWGPIPKSLTYSHIGDKYAQRFDWTVEFSIVKCDTARYEGVKEYSYSVVYEIDKSGLTTRTIQGFLEVAHARENENDRRAHSTADDYREKITPVPPLGFEQNCRFTLSADRSRLDFVITQTERSGSPLPPGVIDANLSEVINSLEPGFVTWQVTISGQYEMAKGFNSVNAVKAFIEFLESRKQAIEAVKKKDEKSFAIVPTYWSAHEPNVYGRKRMVNLTMSFSVNGTLRQLLINGLWEPVRADWGIWRKSLANSAMNPRGFQGMFFDVKDDVIIDLCVNDANGGMKGKHNPPLIDNAVNDGVRQLMQGFVENAVSGAVTEDRSWLDYQLFIKIVPASNVAIHSPLPTMKNGEVPRNPIANANGQEAIETGNLWLSSNGEELIQKPFNRIINEQTAVPDIIQELTPTTYYVLLMGRALRIGYPIGAPELKEALGGVAIPCNDPRKGDGFAQGQVANFGLPVYSAKWKLRYVVAGPRQGADVGMLQNPYYGDRWGIRQVRPAGGGLLVSGTV